MTATASRCAHLLARVPGEEEDPRLTMAASVLRIADEMLEGARPDFVVQLSSDSSVLQTG